MSSYLVLYAMNLSETKYIDFYVNVIISLLSLKKLVDHI